MFEHVLPQTSSARARTRRFACRTWVVLAALSSVSASRADTSAWSGRVGTIGVDDKTFWCTPEILSNASGLPYARSRFQLIASNGAVSDSVPHPLAGQQVKVQCFSNPNHTGTSIVVASSGWSSGNDIVNTPPCPAAQPYADYARCRINTSLLPPYAYAGTSCGDGITGITGPATMRGQMTGDHYELYPPHPPPPAAPYKLFNNTSEEGDINGTDLGFQFHAQGSLYFGFGDSWAIEWMLPGLFDPRGAILYRTNDFNPEDSNGIRFTGWEAVPFFPSVAREVIVSEHDYSGNGEWTAIPGSGLGLTDSNGAAYRFLWFVSIKSWGPPFVANHSTLAWSAGTDPFVRADDPPHASAPIWKPDTYFGVGAIWPDRESGYAYFFGMKTYERSPIRVARVKMTFADLTNRKKYEYWDGFDWIPDTNGDYAPAKLPSQRPGTQGPDLVLLTEQEGRPRPEFSVAYNSWANRFFMMFANLDTRQIEIWQSASITGKWERVGTYPSPTGTHYGPYTSDHLLRNGGQDFYFLLSEWDDSNNGVQPYNVGMWKATFTRNMKPGCIP